MRITTWGINYAPEPTGIAPYNTELCEFLKSRGHEIRMVTAFSYYPAWTKLPADRWRLYRTDAKEGVPIHRCWHYVPARATTACRVLHELSFGLASFLRILTLPRADIYIVVSPPLFLGVLARMAAFLKRSRYVFHVQDLQPDAALGLGMMKSGAFMRLLYGIERFSYRHAVAVSGISESMLAAFERKGVPVEKCWYFPNWVSRSAALMDPAAYGYKREQHSFREFYGIPPDAFLAVYAGNLGRKQGLRILLEAGRLLNAYSPGGRFSSIWIVIAGDGVMRLELERELARDPSSNFLLLPLLPEPAYRAMLIEATVGIVTQARGSGQVVFPSKLLTILAAGLPVLAVSEADSDLARSVAKGRFGVNVAPAEPKKVAQAMIDLTRQPDELRRMVENGRRWVQNFSADKILGEFEGKLRETIRLLTANARE
jgi:colanic acid biosynthesis glycosyl transferase WcaI